jgi:alpha-glucosidase
MIKRLLLLPLLFCVINTVAQANTASEQVSTFIIASPQLQTTKKIWVYLPKDYIQQRDIPFYMHDAQNLFDSKRLMQENGILMKSWTALMPS